MDVLDECDVNECFRIVGFFIKMLWDLKNVKIFVLSRRELDIVEVFKNVNVFVIEISVYFVVKDIEDYVKNEV